MNILRISRAAKATSPVFIVGEARSGTTILYRTLQKHAAFRSKNLWESKIMKHVDAAARFGLGQPRSLLGYMADNEECYDAFLASIAGLRPLLRGGEATLRRTRSRRRKDLIWAASGHPWVVRSYFHHARAARGVTRVLEKTPEHVHHVDRLLRCYPQARLIYIHRHPVDVYTSYIRRAEVDPKASWARITPEAFAERWAEKSTLALRAAARLPESFLLLRYEDFTANPESATRRVCDFIGEPFDPEIIVERNPDLTKRPAAPHLFGQITTKTKQWTDYGNRRVVAEVQRRVQPVMERLDYEPYETNDDLTNRI